MSFKCLSQLTPFSDPARTIIHPHPPFGGTFVSIFQYKIKCNNIQYNINKLSKSNINITCNKNKTSLCQINICTESCVSSRSFTFAVMGTIVFYFTITCKQHIHENVKLAMPLGLIIP